MSRECCFHPLTKLRSDWKQRKNKHNLKNEAETESNPTRGNIEITNNHAIVGEELKTKCNYETEGKLNTESSHTVGEEPKTESVIKEEITMKSDHSREREQSIGGELKPSSNHSIRSEIEAAISNLK